MLAGFFNDLGSGSNVDLTSSAKPHFYSFIYSFILFI
jgi:hypothetical protein